MDPNNQGLVPAQNREAEMAVLGAMLLSEDAIGVVAETLSAADFYKPLHGRMFTAIVELYSQGEGVDIVTLGEALRQQGTLDELGGVAYLRSLVQDVPATANVGHYAGIVAQCSTMRRLAHKGSEIANRALQPDGDVEDALNFAEQSIFELSEQGRESEGLVAIDDDLDATVAAIRDRVEHGTRIIGARTGLDGLDRVTNGLQGGKLYVVCARPGHGKSLFALQLAREVSIRQSQPVALFSLEMTREELHKRMLAAEGRISYTDIESGDLEAKALLRIDAMRERLANVPLWIDDTGSTSVPVIRSRCRRWGMNEPLGLIVVDYLQLLQSAGGNEENRYREVASMTRALKLLAKDLNTPVLLLSQLNRDCERRLNKRPTLGDGYESAGIEHDADVVLGLYRDDLYSGDDSEKNGEIEIIVLKNRSGMAGSHSTVHALFVGHKMQICEPGSDPQLLADELAHNFIDPDDLDDLAFDSEPAF